MEKCMGADSGKGQIQLREPEQKKVQIHLDYSH